MIHHSLIRLLPGLCCLPFGLFSLPVQAQTVSSTSQTQRVPASSLANDARLSPSISIEAVGISLQELLKQVSSASLTLKTDRLCAEQKIQLRLQKRPVRLLMEALADLLPGNWEPLADKSGYILHMSPVAAHRRDKWWELFLHEREEALAAQRAAVLAGLRAQPYRRKPNDPDPEHSNVAIEQEKAAEQGFFNVLSPDLQEHIANNLNDLVLSSQCGPLGFCEEEATQVSFGDLPPAAQENLKKNPSISLFASKREVNWNDVMVRFDNLGYAVMGSVSLSNGDATSVQTSGFIPLTKAPTLSFAPEPLLEAVRRLGRLAPESWKQLAAYQNSRVWPNAAPQHPPRESPPPHRGDVLRQISAQNGIEYVADYYSVPGFPVRPEPLLAHASSIEVTPPKEFVAAQKLKTLLDDMAALHDMSWKQQAGGIYLFRSNRWYWNDLLEVPDALCQRWISEMAKPETQRRHKSWKTVWTPEDIRMQMDWEADVVTNLTLWQIGSGLEWAADENYLATVGKSVPVPNLFPDMSKSFPLGFETTRILREYRTASLYAGLSREQRDALLANRLPFSALSAVQQRQAAALAPRLRALIAENSAPILLGLYSNIGLELLGLNNMPRIRLTAAFVSPP